LGEIRETVR